MSSVSIYVAGLMNFRTADIVRRSVLLRGPQVPGEFDGNTRFRPPTTKKDELWQFVFLPVFCTPFV